MRYYHPDTIYAGMTRAFNRGDFSAAAAYSRVFLRDGAGQPARRLAIAFEIEREAGRRLAESGPPHTTRGGAP